jgi:hypothetical protein
MNTFNQSIHTSITNTDKSESAVSAYWKVKQYHVNWGKIKAGAVRERTRGKLLTVWYL